MIDLGAVAVGWALVGLVCRTVRRARRRERATS
jgi:hypothetical protein